MEDATKRSVQAATEDTAGVSYAPPADLKTMQQNTTSSNQPATASQHYGGYGNKEGQAALRLQSMFRGKEVRRRSEISSGKRSKRTEYNLLEAEDILLDVIESMSNNNKTMVDLEGTFEQ